MELAGRKENAEEPVIFFGALMVGVLFSAFDADSVGTCAAVVAIGDVEGGNFVECGFKRLSICNSPQGVTDTVRGDEVEEGGSLCESCDEGIQIRLIAVGEEDGACLSTQD